VSSPRQQILAENRAVIRGVVDAGSDVAAAIDDWPVHDAATIRDPLSALLEDRDLLEPTLGLLDSGARALGTTIEGTPVPAPPYLTVTSRGPVCRATLADGRRLVVEMRLFEVARRPRRYRLAGPNPEECLDVTLR